MLLRRRLSGLDLILGPLHDDPPAPPAGDPAPGTPPAPPAPPAGGGSGQPPAPPAPGTPPADPDRSAWIPRARFDEVNTRLQALEAAEAKKTEDEAKKRGDFETIDKQQKEKIAAAEAKAERIARRAAFISKAAGKVNDAEAAYKLAEADGMLSTLKVDEDGNADPKEVEKIVDDLVKKYEFLKAASKSRNFGDPADGNGGGPPIDPSKMNATDMLRSGYGTTEPRRRS